MAETTKFPKTNQELAELGGGEAVRFPGTEEEYWRLAEEAENTFVIGDGKLSLRQIYRGTLIKT